LELITSTPIPEFNTGFLGASYKELGKYFKIRTGDISGRPEGYNQESFVVIDDRSLVDKSVLLVDWWVETPKEDLIGYGDDEETLKGWLPTGWHSIRVRLEDAPAVCKGISHSYDYWFVQRSGPENFTEDGVLIMNEADVPKSSK
jgi:hypothetical protein